MSNAANRRIGFVLALAMVATGALSGPRLAVGQGTWEITRESEEALERGLNWLAANQGPQGDWGSDDLGLVAMGALAFLADGNAPGRGAYGRPLERAIDRILSQAKPSGLLNVSNPQRDMYNHGLTTFVLGQVHGMSHDPRITSTLDRSLKLIAFTQCEDGGWDYRAKRQKNGHDLSLAVMQAKALRSAMDTGLEVGPEVVEMAIRSVREHYRPDGNLPRDATEAEQRAVSGRFTYTRHGGKDSLAMAAAGVVCLQEFGQYDDWRIAKNMDHIHEEIAKLKDKKPRNGELPMDAYTLYYVGQALYQVGGDDWDRSYPILRDAVIAGQTIKPESPNEHGRWRAGAHLGGTPSDLYGTSVGCFILAMPNRYLPILQEGRIESFQSNKFSTAR